MSGAALLDALQARLSAPQYAMWFGAAKPIEVADAAVVAVPNAFTRDWIGSHFGDELRRWAASTGTRVELVVDDALNDPPSPADDDAVAAERQVVAQLRIDNAAHQRQVSNGVVVKLLAERGFWSLTASHQRQPYLVEDLGGTLEVIPSVRGASGVYEACVFTGLVSLWADGPRDRPVVETSLRRLAATLKLSWSGRTADQLRNAIELLKTTSYRTTVQTPDGGADRLFSLLDEIATRWNGAPTTPHRHVRAVFSRTAFEIIRTPRILRRVDVDVLRALGSQRDLARRLFLFLEAQPGHVLGDRGREIIERVIDGRLAATLGTELAVRRLVRQLDRAGEAITAVAPRYVSVAVIPRRKRGLGPGEPRHALRVVRTRLLRPGRSR